MRKVLVTGAGGFVGRHLLKQLSEAGFVAEGLVHGEMEITDEKAVLSSVGSAEPDIIVHCAAISSTGYAKEHPDESLAVNVEGSVNVARACRAFGIKLFTMSSDQVYSGCTLDGALKEDLTLSPNNPYGAHKYLMEQRVLEICPDAVALRLAWMFEPYNPANPHTDIISRLTAMKSSAAPAAFSTGELRGMSDVRDVCSNVIASFSVLPGGVYNFGSENRLHTFDAMSVIAGRCGISQSCIVPDTSWSRNISMDCSKLRSFGISFPDTVTAVADCFNGSGQPIR